MSGLAIIGGSGLARLGGLQVRSRESVDTPYGPPSAPLCRGRLEGAELVFLPRHGEAHQLPPHAINYRANLWALKAAGVRRVLAVAAVGGISPHCPPRRLVIPDQVIDYTWGRDHTYFDGPGAPVTHVDWTQPYSASLRRVLLEASAGLGLDAHDGGTYGATQGPRLESAAEIERMARDGCDLVGQTGMPETVLARELGLDYACCAVVANWAAGRVPGVLSMEQITADLDAAMTDVLRLLGAGVRALQDG